MTTRRITPDIDCADPAAGHEFYRDVLGLEVAMDLGWIVTFVSPANRTAQLNLVQTSQPAPASDYSVEVADVDSSYAQACAQGLSIVHPLTTEAWGVRRFFVRDPHGKIANVLSHAGPRSLTQAAGSDSAPN